MQRQALGPGVFGLCQDLLQLQLRGHATAASLLGQVQRLFLNLDTGVHQCQSRLLVTHVGIGLHHLGCQLHLGIGQLRLRGVVLRLGRLDCTPGAAEQVGLPAGIKAGEVKAQWPATTATAATQRRGVGGAQLQHRCIAGDLGQGVGVGATQAGSRLLEARLGGRHVRTVLQGLGHQLVELRIAQGLPPLGDRGCARQAYVGVGQAPGREGLWRGIRRALVVRPHGTRRQQADGEEQGK